MVGSIDEFKGWNIFSYKDWLAKQVAADPMSVDLETQADYISILHNIPFIYKLPLDSNRYADGIKLRKIYMKGANIPSVLYGEDKFCSVLEMLVALAIRCHDEMFDVTSPAVFFWDWVRNLVPGLSRNPDYILEAVNTWLAREFDEYGYGSPFPLRKIRPVYDQRKVHIWSQMCGYLSENFLGME